VCVCVCGHTATQIHKTCEIPQAVKLVMSAHRAVPPQIDITVTSGRVS